MRFCSSWSLRVQSWRRAWSGRDSRPPADGWFSASVSGYKIDLSRVRPSSRQDCRITATQSKCTVCVHPSFWNLDDFWCGYLGLDLEESWNYFIRWPLTWATTAFAANDCLKMRLRYLLQCALLKYDRVKKEVIFCKCAPRRYDNVSKSCHWL